MKTPEQILIEVANEHSYNDWGELMYDTHESSQIEYTKEAMEIYANQQNTTLQTELAQVRKEREWVSVNEPPKIGERVLLLVECIGESYVAIGHRKADNLYYKDKGTLSKPMETICKWMPLPAAPDNIK